MTAYLVHLIANGFKNPPEKCKRSNKTGVCQYGFSDIEYSLKSFLIAISHKYTFHKRLWDMEQLCTMCKRYKHCAHTSD